MYLVLVLVLLSTLKINLSKSDLDLEQFDFFALGEIDSNISYSTFDISWIVSLLECGAKCAMISNCTMAVWDSNQNCRLLQKEERNDSEMYHSLNFTDGQRVWNKGRRLTVEEATTAQVTTITATTHLATTTSENTIAITYDDTTTVTEGTTETADGDLTTGRKTTITLTTSLTSGLICPDEFNRTELGCFYFGLTKRTWDEAKVECENTGHNVNLITITTLVVSIIKCI